MKINKTILVGILFIIIAGILFITDILNPVIHPITQLFLMGSSKGKDIIFFGLMGIFLISSQIFKDLKIDSKKFLKISIILGSILLIAGIAIEILFRYQLGIGLNCIFMTTQKTVTSTSILHTHTLKSIFGELLTNVMGPYIQSEINTGAGLYPYIPELAKIVMILFPILFFTLLLSLRNRKFATTLIGSFAGTCLLIGALDGGLFSTPAIVGICGLLFVERNGFCVEIHLHNMQKEDHISCEKCQAIPPHKNKKELTVKIIKRYAPFVIAGVLILLRLTISFLGANAEYYEVEVANPVDNLELNDFPIENVSVSENKTTYIINSDYNEMKLLNDVKVPLSNKCDYFTVTWNIYSYF